MGYKEQNSKVIAQAFATATKRMNESIQIGFEELLEAGMEYCLNYHGNRHQHHLEMDDAYGWMLLYNGAEVRKRIYGHPGGEKSNASEALDKVKGSCPSTGWCGVVLAGMEPINYFMVSKEFGIMRNSIRDIKAENFDEYFKPMTI